MGLLGSVLIANPVPSDKEIPSAEMEKLILMALEAAKMQRIAGKAVTPFLLKYISDHSNGESLEANIALIKHNAYLGAKVAVEFSNLHNSK